MGTTDIAVVGSLMVDHILKVNRVAEKGETLAANKYHKSLGGKGANAAIAAYRTCHNKSKDGEQTANTDSENNAFDIGVRMIGRLGKDENAKLFRDALEANGINIDKVLDDEEGRNTAMTFIVVEEETHDNRIISVGGAGDALCANDFSTVEGFGHGPPPKLIVSQLEIDIKAVEQMLETAGNNGIKFLLNAAPANSILTDKFRYITHLLVNESEAAILWGRELADVKEETWPTIAKAFLKDGAKNVVITLGEHGAYFANKNTSGHVPAFPIIPEDPTGAGDTFTGAYASEYVRQMHVNKDLNDDNWDIEAAVVHACRAAALTVATLGAQEGIPWADEIEDFKVRQDAVKAAGTITSVEEHTKEVEDRTRN